MSESLIKLAKDKLDIPTLWRLRGWPREPARECFRPYAEDTRKSGSVFEDGRLFRDFKSGETLDAPALLARVENLSNSAACCLFIDLAGIARERHGSREAPARRTSARFAPPPPPLPREPVKRMKPTLPELREPEPHDLDVIADLRHVTARGPELAAARGLLFVCRYGGAACWAVTDATRWNCQFRRMDGSAFECDGTAKKTLGIRGGWAAWPIGAAEMGLRENVLLVEGTGDFIAAHAFAWIEGTAEKTSVVCIPGASVRLPLEALPLFEGKRIRIFPHLDASGAGAEAALRWETQLEAAGAARVECFDLSGLVMPSGEPVGDLNDLARLPRVQLEELGPLTRF
jgi:hypothetical protein